MTFIARKIGITNDGESLFSGLEFSVDNGAILSVMGPSGSGKSSLLNFISGTLDTMFSTSGALYLDDVLLNNLPTHRRRIGLQFQDHLLFPHMTVGENLTFGIPKHYRRPERLKMVREALTDCGLEGFDNKTPENISGGQRARISLMRTLLSEPRLILLDEPFSKLDAELRGQFREFVFGQIKSRNIPALMVTHDAQDLPISGQVINLQDYHSNS